MFQQKDAGFDKETKGRPDAQASPHPVTRPGSLYQPLKKSLTAPSTAPTVSRAASASPPPMSFAASPRR